MKNYILGTVISAICFIVMIIINLEVYNNAMSLSLFVSFLVLHIILFKYVITTKKVVRYFIFISIFIAISWISLPDVTLKKAREKVIDKYQITIIKEDTIPVNNNDWNPFLADRAYLFKGFDAEDKDISIIVSSDTGKTFKINE